jgi:hypothetical protein
MNNTTIPVVRVTSEMIARWSRGWQDETDDLDALSAWRRTPDGAAAVVRLEAELNARIHAELEERRAHDLDPASRGWRDAVFEASARGDFDHGPRWLAWVLAGRARTPAIA